MKKAGQQAHDTGSDEVLGSVIAEQQRKHTA
jgi:hypothetical protein